MAHLETTHTTHDGEDLYLQAWVPEDFKAAVLIVHGLAEHSGRYAHLAEFLNDQGYAVYTFDGRGHGKSANGAPDAFYANIDDYTKDVDALYGKMKEHAAGKPCFIFGHSMGGCVVAYYEITHQPDTSGILLSGPAVIVGDDISPFLIRVSRFLSHVAPKMSTTTLDGNSISRDPIEVEKYNNDPLNFRGGIKARVGAEMLRAIEVITTRKSDFKNPVLIMHGTEDRLTAPQGSQELFDGAASADKSLKLYEGLYHELVNEPEKQLVMNDMLEWMEARM
ncbi:MAG: lysophospholipase [Chloroflexota bacterium]